MAARSCPRAEDGNNFDPVGDRRAAASRGWRPATCGRSLRALRRLLPELDRTIVGRPPLKARSLGKQACGVHACRPRKADRSFAPLQALDPCGHAPRSRRTVRSAG